MDDLPATTGAATAEAASSQYSNGEDFTYTLDPHTTDSWWASASRGVARSERGSAVDGADDSQPLLFVLRNSISDSLVDDVVLWLKRNAPPDIAQVSITELTDQTRELRDFIAEQSESRSANALINMDQLPTESQDQVRDAWLRFTGRLVHSLRHFGLQDYKDMNWFIRDFEANNNSLRRTVEREILTTPQLYEAEHLERGIQLPRSQILGLADAFRDIKRLNRLAEALKAASAGHFRTLACLGHVVLPVATSAKYGLVFQRPRGGCEPVTLYTLLLEQQSQARRTITIPTLGERIRLAFEIAQALMRWHLAGWLHQGIASFHIIFKTSPTTVDYSKPYLVGFNYTRENDSSSATRAGGPTTAEKIRDMYRHPERQGSRPPKKHLRKHDLYALGLLLIEIGRWISLGDVFHSAVSNTLGDLSSVPKAARKLTERVLAFNMGAAYRDATAASLQGHLGVVEDDEHGTRFIADFESQVVRKLEAGLKIDE
ncbi:hypothetical protein BGZ61DRAFT_519263 [Ilyonectria robusta]|uniref:uncharacterized protein n=1 Tax=Ilyonectria robusta TaxID=1079257 RepID=UPI001E8D90A0|nr:uncharacterized protein BGZ61DRAFT_519263 [Ilyonectria robusta]KAH8684948.1 hypothetical protein BGZ61DRAFT_519263 [Ilyonectria robusta]